MSLPLDKSLMFPYIHINQDGTARELSLWEREYLSKTFEPCDGNRPYIKLSYGFKNAFGSLSGYLCRADLPAHIEIRSVNRDFCPPKYSREDMIAEHEAVGDTVTIEGNCISFTPNLNISKKERFELLKKIYLEKEAKWELKAFDT